MKFLRFFSPGSEQESATEQLFKFLQESPELAGAETSQIMHLETTVESGVDALIGYTDPKDVYPMQAAEAAPEVPRPDPRRTMRQRPVQVPHPTPPQTLEPVFPAVGILSFHQIETAPIDGRYVTLIARSDVKGFPYKTALCNYDPMHKWRTYDGKPADEVLGKPIGWLPAPEFKQE